VNCCGRSRSRRSRSGRDEGPLPPFTEPHSTKQIEDAIGWGLRTDPQTILRGMDAEWLNDRENAFRLCAQVRCPTLVIQGSEDAVVGAARGAAVAGAIPHAQLITLEGSGHAPHLRDPVITNLLIRDFVSPGDTSLAPGKRVGGNPSGVRISIKYPAGPATASDVSLPPSRWPGLLPLPQARLRRRSLGEIP
jgi:TAP-like protein